MSFAENSNGFTPSFVSLALSGITHRFILVLECESRQYEGEVAVSHPRFCVGGPRATLDPRNVSITDLLPLGASKVDLPVGWEKVHQLLYVVQQSTDEHGWQYRSSWPSKALEAGDEHWSNNNASNADVRRRLWMTTVVKRDDVLAAKRKISELVLSRQRGTILKGPLLRLEEDESGEKKWISRRCSLTDEKIEVYDNETGEKIDELLILGHQIKMLDGFAFSVRKLDGSSCVLFDTDSKETRRRWLIAISYQIAVRGPLIDFAPFPYAPPLGEDVSNRIILCGDLLKKGQTGMNWKNRFFKLTPRELQYFDREALKGSIKIDGATVKTDEKSLEISLRSKSGVTVVVKTDCIANKIVWATAFETQIEILASKISSVARSITAEERALHIHQDDDNDSEQGNVVIPSVALKEMEALSTKGGNAEMSSPSFPIAESNGNTDPTANECAPYPMTPRTEKTRAILMSFVSSPNLVIGSHDAAPEGEADPSTLPHEGKAPLVEFITEEEDISEEEWKPEDGIEEVEEEAGDDITDAPLSPNREREESSEGVFNDNEAINESTNVDGNTSQETEEERRQKAFSKFRPKSLKFGIQPDTIVCLADFGIAPELLTTAQKVAILESAAYQHRSQQAIMPKREGTRKSFNSPAINRSASSEGYPDGYTATGLRLQEEKDTQDISMQGDGGAVAQTGDPVRSKISKWEGWVKDKEKLTSPAASKMAK